jgi:hypothetical protein
MWAKDKSLTVTVWRVAVHFPEVLRTLEELKLYIDQVKLGVDSVPVASAFILYFRRNASKVL